MKFRNIQKITNKNISSFPLSLDNEINIIQTITNKAKADWVGTFPRNHADPRFKQWQEHWLATGKAWYNELRKNHKRGVWVGLNYILNYYGKNKCIM